MHKTITAWAPRALSVLRIYTGLLLLEHGTAKILGFPAVPSFANLQLGSLVGASGLIELVGGDRKSTRLNSSHSQISYAVFCLKKKKKNYSNTYHSCVVPTLLSYKY